MPCKRLQTSYHPSANSLTLVPTGTTEYIAAGDSQAAVPFPTEILRDCDLQWKMDSDLSYLLLQLAITGGKRAFRRRAQRRPHPARREVTCGDTDMDWPKLGAVLHTTGLWGRSYLGVGRRAASRTWQKLCQREDTGLPWGKPYHGRIHIWDYPKGNQAIRTPSPVQGLTGNPGELTPVLGLESDCYAQSDCRGCLEDSTRVHHPGNWTGGGKRGVEWALTPRGHGSLCDWYTKATASTIKPSLSADLRGRQRAAQIFWSSGCGPHTCAMLLRDTATLRLDLPPLRAVLAGSPPDHIRASFEPWARIQAEVSRQRENRPARTQGNLWWKWARSGALFSRQEFQLDWVQRLKGAPLKSSQDDREVPGGHKGWPEGVHPPGTLQEPHDKIMLSQGPAVHCIVVSRDTLQGGGWQPTLQPFLQGRKHYSNRASSGVFSARRTPVREQTPFQCVGLPCWRSSSLSDGLYHCRWKTAQVCRVPSRSHTWRFYRSGRGCHMVPSPWERRSFLRGMRQGGVVARKMSSENNVRMGKSGATSRTWSSSSLSLHSICASRLTGGNTHLTHA